MTADGARPAVRHPGRRRRVDVHGLRGGRDPEPQPTLCSYRFEGGSTTFRMSYSDDDGWTVFEVFQTAD